MLTNLLWYTSGKDPFKGQHVICRLLLNKKKILTSVFYIPTIPTSLIDDWLMKELNYLRDFKRTEQFDFVLTFDTEWFISDKFQWLNFF